MAQHDEAVPKWHADFLKEFGAFREQNQREHGAIAWRMAGLFILQTGTLIAVITLFT